VYAYMNFSDTFVPGRGYLENQSQIGNII